MIQSNSFTLIKIESCVADPDCAVEEDYDGTSQVSSESNGVAGVEDSKVIDKKLIKVLNYLLKKNKHQQQQQLDTSFDKK